MREKLSSGIRSRSDTNQAVKPQKIAGGLGIIYAAKTKVLISYAVTVQLIFAFVVVFSYAKGTFSHDAAHIFFIITNDSDENPKQRFL